MTCDVSAGYLSAGYVTPRGSFKWARRRCCRLDLFGVDCLSLRRLGCRHGIPLDDLLLSAMLLSAVAFSFCDLSLSFAYFSDLSMSFAEFGDFSVGDVMSLLV